MVSLRVKCYILLLASSLLLLLILVCGTGRCLSRTELTMRTAPTKTISYEVDSSITFLHDKKLFLPSSKLIKTPWMRQIKDYLSNHDSNTIIMVSANHLFEDILFNWLAAAQLQAGITPNKVLILSLDDVIYQTLLDHGIGSVHISSDQVFRLSAHMHTSLSHLWIIRCMVIRLLNYWDYDVMMFDLDAIILKDPRPIFAEFHKSDIVGSQGKYPFQLGHKWGVTLCMGVVLFRSTPSISKNLHPLRYTYVIINLQCNIERLIIKVLFAKRLY